MGKSNVREVLEAIGSTPERHDRREGRRGPARHPPRRRAGLQRHRRAGRADRGARRRQAGPDHDLQGPHHQPAGALACRPAGRRARAARAPDREHAGPGQAQGRRRRRSSPKPRAEGRAAGQGQAQAEGAVPDAFDAAAPRHPLDLEGREDRHRGAVPRDARRAQRAVRRPAADDDGRHQRRRARQARHRPGLRRGAGLGREGGRASSIRRTRTTSRRRSTWRRRW